MWTAGKPSLHIRLRDLVVAGTRSDRPTLYRQENVEKATHFRYLNILYQWIRTSETCTAYIIKECLNLKWRVES